MIYRLFDSHGNLRGVYQVHSKAIIELRTLGPYACLVTENCQRYQWHHKTPKGDLIHRQVLDQITKYVRKQYKLGAVK